jgi:hypothetical protein
MPTSSHTKLAAEGHLAERELLQVQCNFINPDVGYPDAGYPDSGYPDSGYPDAGYPVAGYPDAGYPDAGCPDRLGPSGEFVENSTELTCLEITSYRIKYSTVLWLLQFRIRRGRKV